MSVIRYKFIERLPVPAPIDERLAEGDALDTSLNKLQGQIDQIAFRTTVVQLSGTFFVADTNLHGLRVIKLVDVRNGSGDSVSVANNISGGTVTFTSLVDLTNHTAILIGE